jgi:hypothetical protein
MAEIAAGQYRFGIRDSRGLLRDFSEQMSYDILDRSTVPRIAFNGTGTVQDQQISWYNSADGLGVVSGPTQELLVLQFLDPTARTTTTANFVIKLNVMTTYRDYKGSIQRKNNPLALADRVTKTTSGTRQDPNGVNDNPATVANQWTDVLAFKPLPNETWYVSSYQRFVSDGV